MSKAPGREAEGSVRFDFSGHVAVVTGGSSGIGAATVELLATAGARVAVLSRSEARARDALSRLPKDAPPATWIGCDATDEAAVVAAFARIQDEVGVPTVLVNSAGLLMRAMAEETTKLAWDEVVAVNLTATFLCSREAARLMRREGRGSIVNVSSEAGLRGIKGLAAYSVAKAAVIELTRCMALDLADAGVRVNCVCPGTTRTPMVLEAVAATADPDAELRRYATVRPLQRLGTPREIATAIGYLASDDAAYTTGSVLAVDGGYTA